MNCPQELHFRRAAGIGGGTDFLEDLQGLKAALFSIVGAFGGAMPLGESQQRAALFGAQFVFDK